MRLKPLRSLAACWTIAVLMSSVAWAAEPPPQPATPPAATDKPAPEAGSLGETVCQIREEPITGTRITRKRKICRTRREWLQETRIGQDALKRVQDTSRTSNGVAGGRTNPGGH